MGILKAVTGAMKSVLDEQWREFFSCDAIGSDWLLVRGKTRIGPRSANTRVDDDVLTNGSILAVADGQCVLVVKQGKVIDVCAEPGEHIFEDPEQGGVKGFFREVGRRVCFGGGDIQPTVYRVYYLNVLEITGIPFETPAAIPLRVRDPVTGMDLDSSVRLSGCCSYRVSDPVKLYKTVIGNVRGNFSRREIDSHMRADLIKALQSALAACAAAGIRPSRLPAHVPDLCEALREKMAESWCGQHGLEIASIAADGLLVTDQATVTGAQHAAILRDPAMAAATLTQAAAEAMPAAAKASGAAPLAAAIVSPAAPAVVSTPAPAPTEPARRLPWKCVCGTVSDRKFCPDCGRPRP